MNPQVSFDQVVERGCGMDIHRDTIVATVLGAGIQKETRTYSSYTNSLRECRDWLKSLSVTHIAMESTGIYWKPVFNILEDGFDILLVNAYHVKNVPGHKTDKKDSVWLAKLLISGLLKASFIPPREIRELRDLSRYRRKLTQQATGERNRFEKILQDANFKISNVISDVFGLSGTKLIDALLRGNDNFDELLELCHGRIRNKKDELKQALEGNLTAHHKFMLRAIRKSLDSILNKVRSLDKQTEQLSKPYALELQLLQTIPGINKIASACLLSEIGNDMSKFPTELHLASWAGMCPGNNQSAGKNKDARVTQGNQYLKPVLVECAWSASHVKDCYLRNKYESLIGRRGKKRALIAVGHKILIAAYHILKDKIAYKDLGYGYLDTRRKKNQVQSYLDKLKNLGVDVQINGMQQ
ncbi:MAG: IS110 family transposase [Bacteroidetes bacterium]|nr:IS110 family transposase [Bacteroidota bacterium]